MPSTSPGMCSLWKRERTRACSSIVRKPNARGSWNSERYGSSFSGSSSCAVDATSTSFSFASRWATTRACDSEPPTTSAPNRWTTTRIFKARRYCARPRAELLRLYDIRSRDLVVPALLVRIERHPDDTDEDDDEGQEQTDPADHALDY